MRINKKISKKIKPAIAGFVAALTAVTPVLTPVLTYAAEIDADDVTNIKAHTQDTKFLFLNIQSSGGAVTIGEDTDAEHTVRLEKQEDTEKIDVYDQDSVLISSENAKDN